jgi:hypothetical protein
VRCSGPLAAGAIAQAASLLAGLLVAPAATLLAAATLAARGRTARAGARFLRRARIRSGSSASEAE